LFFLNTPGFTRGWRCSSPSGLPGERIVLCKLRTTIALVFFFQALQVCL
jgi:hypothetical protein